MKKQIEIKSDKQHNQKIEKAIAIRPSIKKNKEDAEYKIVKQNSDYFLLSELQSF